jgi:hypothetical protein
MRRGVTRRAEYSFRYGGRQGRWRGPLGAADHPRGGELWAHGRRPRTEGLIKPYKGQEEIAVERMDQIVVME